jgi:hypothetical protein
VVRGDGKPLFARDRNLPRLETLKDIDPAMVPEGDAEDAMQVANARFKQDVGADPNQSTSSRLEIWVDGEEAAHLAHTFTLATSQGKDFQVYRFWIEARQAKGEGDREIFFIEKINHHAHRGKVIGNVWPDRVSPLTPTAHVAVPWRLLRSSSGPTTAFRPRRRAFTLPANGTQHLGRAHRTLVLDRQHARGGT